MKLNKPSTPSTGPFKDKQSGRDSLANDVSDLREAQARLDASQKQGVLILFRSLDAGGKDGTIKHVMSGINP